MPGRELRHEQWHARVAWAHHSVRRGRNIRDAILYKPMSNPTAHNNKHEQEACETKRPIGSNQSITQAGTAHRVRARPLPCQSPQLLLPCDNSNEPKMSNVEFGHSKKKRYKKLCYSKHGATYEQLAVKTFFKPARVNDCAPLFKNLWVVAVAGRQQQAH